MTLNTGANGVEQVAEDARDSTALQWSARLGFGMYGVVYLLLGWLALQVAFGERGGEVSKHGAFHQLAQQPLGKGLLWAACAAFVALIVYELCQLVVGHRDKEGAARAAASFGTVLRIALFALLAFSAAEVALGEPSKSTDSYTAALMEMPAGPLLVGAVGLAVLAYAAWSVVKGLTDRWRKELDAQGRTGDVGRALTVLARVGYTSRGAAFAVVGCLFVWAALTHDARRSGGLDEAVTEMRQAPFGPVLLAVVAAGLICYGLFNVAKVRHLRPRH